MTKNVTTYVIAGCSDWFEWFDSSPQPDSKEPSSGTGHVIRNGSWENGVAVLVMAVVGASYFLIEDKKEEQITGNSQ